MNKILLYIISLILFSYSLKADTTKRDSIWAIWSDTTKPDTQRLKSIHTISWMPNVFSKPDSAFIFAEMQKHLAIRTGHKKWEASALNTQGVLFHVRGNIKEALKYYDASYDIKKGIADKKGMAVSYNNFGIIHGQLGDFSKSLESYHKALVIEKELNNDKGIARIYNNMGLIYHQQIDINKALEYYQIALAILIRINDQYGIAEANKNLGDAHNDLLNFSKALEYHETAITIFKDINHLNGLGQTYNSISQTFKNRKNLTKALTYSKKALNLFLKLDDKQNTVVSYNALTAIFLAQKNTTEALKYGIKGLQLAEKINFPRDIKNSAEQLSIVYKKMGKYKKALEMSDKFIEMRDSLYNKESTQKLTRVEVEEEYKRKMFADSLLNDQQVKINEIKLDQERKSQKAKTFIASIAFLLLLIIAYVLYNRNQVKNRANIILSEKNELINSQKKALQKEQTRFLDSMNYAEKIQRSIMLPEDEIKKLYPKIFIYFKSKDIVSGDFYWFNKKKNTCIIAAIDCTGHGVPGAFMCMIGNTLLNEIINDKGITDPGEILNHLNKGVTMALQQDKDGEYAQDGMDLSICTIDLKSKNLCYAGAKNPVYLIHDNKMEVIKGDVFSIGGQRYINEKVKKAPVFSTKCISIEKDTSVYLFTDGFMDQFGGEDNSKFNTKRFKTMLLDIHQKEPHEQKNIIEKTMDSWKGKKKQIDDMLIIGMKV